MIKAGKYEVKVGTDEDGRTVYYLYDPVTDRNMPDHYTCMTAAIVAGLLDEF